jgi:ribosomal protein S11
MGYLSELIRVFIPNKSMRQVGQPGYMTDMQQIETMFNTLLAKAIQDITSTDGTVTITDPNGPVVDLSAAGSGGGGYVSLTGPGETATPGALTQAGPFIVNSATGDVVVTTSGASSAIKLLADGTQGITISTNLGSGSVAIISNNSIGLGITNSGIPGIQLSSTAVTIIGPGGDSEIAFALAGITLSASGATGIKVINEFTATAGVIISNSGTTYFNASAGKLGFFGATPITQPAAPTTLADVITLLTNLGLCA